MSSRAHVPWTVQYPPRMRRTLSLTAAVIVTTLGIGAIDLAPRQATTTPELKGAWVGESLHRGGRSAPPEMVKSVRMTFGETSLAIAGYFGPDEEAVSYSVDRKASPHHLDLSTPGGEKIPGIYEVRDGKLIVALPSKGSSERPKALTSEQGSAALLFVMRKAD